jgi:hypothetical protein
MKQRYENKREKCMDSNNRKSYLKSRKKWHALSRANFRDRKTAFVSFQDDKKTVIQNFKNSEAEN